MHAHPFSIYVETKSVAVLICIVHWLVSFIILAFENEVTLLEGCTLNFHTIEFPHHDQHSHSKIIGGSFILCIIIKSISIDHSLIFEMIDITKVIC